MSSSQDKRFRAGLVQLRSGRSVAANLEQAEAQLAETEANLLLAKNSFDRVKDLFRDKLISKQEYD